MRSHPIFILNNYSSIYVRGVYSRFAVDFMLELAAGIECIAIFLTATSLYVGLCFYTKAMVDDLTSQMQQIKRISLDAKQRIQAVEPLVDGIQLHAEITG